MNYQDEQIESRGGDQYWDGDAPRVDRRRFSKNTVWLVILVSIVMGMVVFAFANARYFDMLCAAIGIQQTRSGTGLTVEMTGDDAELGRDIQVLFIANVQGQLPVSFRPVEKIQKTRLGKMSLNDYHFVNVANRPVYFMPIHNYRPPEANNDGIIELGKCFCFEPQMLHAGEEKSLPIVYKISPDLGNSVAAVTFYYTLFEMTEQEYREWWAEQDVRQQEAVSDDAG